MGTIFSPILQTRKLGYKKVKQLSQDHTTGRLWRQLGLHAVSFHALLPLRQTTVYILIITINNWRDKQVISDSGKCFEDHREGSYSLNIREDLYKEVTFDVRSESPTWGTKEREFQEAGTGSAKALRWESDHPCLTHPTAAAFMLAIVHQYPTYQSCVIVIECWNWEKLADYPNSWFYRSGNRSRRARSQYHFNVERWVVSWVHAVRMSVTLSNIRHHFKGMWLGSLTMPDVGACQVSSPFHMSQVELTITWLALHLALSPCWQYIIPAQLPRDILAFWLLYFPLNLRTWSTRWVHTSFWPDATLCVYLSAQRPHLASDLSKLSPHGVVRLLGNAGWLNPYVRAADSLLFLVVDC